MNGVAKYVSLKFWASLLTRRTKIFVFIYHLILVLPFFLRFFISGEILTGNTDVLTFSAPMFFVMKDAFLQKEFPLWNPYQLCGVPFSLYANAHNLNFENWILFISPEKYLFQIATLFAFMKHWLLGVISFFVFQKEICNAKWALFSSTTYQLCGQIIWGLMLFDLFSLWFWMTVAFYCIWTFNNRSNHKNFIFLFSALLALLLPAHIPSAAFALLLISILILYKNFPFSLEKQNIRRYLCYILAVSAAFLVFCLRLVPTLHEYLNSGRALQGAWNPAPLTELILRLFNPVIFGVNNFESHSCLLRQRYPHFQIDGVFNQYFGIVTALLACWAIVNLKALSRRFFFIFSMIILSILIQFTPLAVIFYSVFGGIGNLLPLNAVFPFIMCMAIGGIGVDFEKSLDQPFQKKQTNFFIILLFVAILMSYYSWFNFNKFPAIFVLGSVILIWQLILRFIWCKKIPIKLHLLFLGIGIVSFIEALRYKLGDGSENIAYYSSNLLFSITLCCWVIWWILSNKKIYSFCILAIVSISILIYLSICQFKTQLLVADSIQLKNLAKLGTIYFSIFGTAFIVLWKSAQTTESVRKLFFPTLLALLIVDLLPISHLHGYAIKNPFYSQSTLYPGRLLPINELIKKIKSFPEEIDAKNYRFNFPNLLVSNMIPWYVQMYGNQEILGSIFSAYKMRSYGGYYNAAPNSYVFFCNQLLEDKEPTIESIGLKTIVTNERFLDLTGVKYNFNEKENTINLRKNPLPRFSIFYDATYVTEPKILSENLKKKLDINKTVILDYESKLKSNLKSEKLEFAELSYDKITLEVNAKKDGVILFLDSFHPGWISRVNGENTKILKANVNFMGVMVKQGKNSVSFQFQPKGTNVARILCAGGFLVAIASFIYFYKTR